MRGGGSDGEFYYKFSLFKTASFIIVKLGINLDCKGGGAVGGGRWDLGCSRWPIQ